MVLDFRVSRRAEWNPKGVPRGETRKGMQRDRKGLTWSIFELELQMEVTKFKY